jgi:hypothetical protein
MIQRIQSVYLFLAAIVLFSMFFHPLVEIVDTGKMFYRFDLSGIYEGMGDTAKKIESVLPLRFLVFVTAALSLITIFFYKRRIMQIRICIFNLMLLLGFYGLFLFYFFHMRNQLDVSITDLKITIVFPMIGFILVFLATRGIRKDELLVRSYNRIR